MAINPYCNKVVYGNQTIIDLSNDTITANKLLLGTIAHDASGAIIVGTLNNASNCIIDEGIFIQGAIINNNIYIPNTGSINGEILII